MTSKLCPGCRVVQDAVTDFHKGQSRCKTCRNAEYRTAYREQGPQFRAEAVARVRKHRAEHGRPDHGIRRARQFDAHYERFTRRELWDSYVERELFGCVYCGGTYEHDDHAVPLARGGAHAIANLVPACAACNMEKHTRTPDEYMRQRRSR